MKIISTEVLMIRHGEVPVITGIYDPLSRKSDGTISSQAPLIISGRHFDLFDRGSIRLCLASAVDYGRMIEVHHVYKYTAQQVIISLPVLKPGEYLPAVKIWRKGEEPWLYIFPVSWVVTR